MLRKYNPPHGRLYVDLPAGKSFEVDDLIALEKRAIAEFKRVKAEARERDERAARETKQERELREALVAEFGEDGWKL